MGRDGWQRVKEIVGEALECTGAERSCYLDRTCGGDRWLRSRVESLLAYERRGDSRIDSPLWSIHDDRPEIGRRVGPYELLRLLGRGGMGSVYLAARRTDFEKLVALKLLRQGLASAEILRRFHNERQILALFEHPNIVRLLDGGVTSDGRPYLVMEYVEGEPICDYCDRRRLSIHRRLELLRKVCSAVHHAHRNLVVHRDLKPDNLLVTPEGTPKVVDFGIGKILRSDPVFQTLDTAPGRRPMTHLYASPEQIRGDPVGPASDVYTLGVVLYELLTGHCPYRLDDRSGVEIRRVVCEQVPAKPSVVVCRRRWRRNAAGDEVLLTPESSSRARGTRPRGLRRCLAGDLDAIVLRAMEKEPRHRFASAAALSAALERHLKGASVDGRRRALARIQEPSSGERWQLPAFLLVAGAGLAALAFRTRAADRSPTVATHAAGAASRETP